MDLLADALRVATVILASIFFGMGLWFYTRTKFLSGRVMLLAIAFLSSASVISAVYRLGEEFTPSLPFPVLGFVTGIIGLRLWRRERYDYRRT